MVRFVLLLTLVILPASAGAQAFEVGGGVSRGCDGDSSGFCGPNAGAMWSVHASVWLTDRLEVAVRAATLPLPDFRFVTHRDDRFNLASDPAIRQLDRIDMSVTHHSRRILSGEALYHFGRDGRPRAMVGLGLGDLRFRTTTSCSPAGCETLLPILGHQLGPDSWSVANVTLVAGISAPVMNAIRLRAGVRLHNFAGEENATTELFVSAGYRFGGR